MLSVHSIEHRLLISSFPMNYLLLCQVLKYKITRISRITCFDIFSLKYSQYDINMLVIWLNNKQLERKVSSMGWIENRKNVQQNICRIWWGSLLPCLHTLDTSLYPPFINVKIVNHTEKFWYLKFTYGYRFLYEVGLVLFSFFQQDK